MNAEPVWLSGLDDLRDHRLSGSYKSWGTRYVDKLLPVKYCDLVLLEQTRGRRWCVCPLALLDSGEYHSQFLDAN